LRAMETARMMKIYANWWKKTVLTTFEPILLKRFLDANTFKKKKSFAHTNGYSAYWYDSKWFSKISGTDRKQLKILKRDPVLVPLSIIWRNGSHFGRWSSQWKQAS
jgi:hypothetical protein